MKKRHSIHLLLAAAALLLATTACTKDELADGDRLPEGQYPLEIARITLGVEGGEAQPWGAPQTRVSENGDGTGSVFDAGDRFAVQINAEEGIYIVQDDESIKAESPLYWSDSGEHTVTAWYPATGGTLDLSDQSQSLAYLLGGSGTGDYLTPVTLTFAHRLAKVRVTPTGDALGEVQSLQLYTYTQCTYEKGTVVQGSQEGWIEMKRCEYTENGVSFTCWEANVVPGYEITKLMANNDNKERDLSTTITPEAGSYYNITLDKDKGYTDDGQGNYTVTSAEGLKNIAKLVNEEGKTDIDITLTGNITLTGEWTPIGTESQPYTGTFDGDGHRITGLKIDQSGTDCVGLIGRLGSGGKVQGVALTNISVSGANYVGGIAGQNDGTVENCSVNGTVTGRGFTDTGGIVGTNYGTISGCSAEGTVTGSVNVGGIAGGSYLGATIVGCYSSAAVEGSSTVGGVVGSLGNNSSLTACYSTGNVTATRTDGGAYVGGVVGVNAQGTVTACYHATGEITSSGGDRIGGIAGSNGQGTFTACYWENNQEQGTGSGSTGGTVHVTDGNWHNAANAMNAALNAESWQYTFEPGNSLPLLVQKP